MSRSLFGTDGVRGRANTHPMTAETALRLGAAVACHFRHSHQDLRVVIGKDTRLSGYMIEYALTAGFASAGMDVFLLGPMPTPAISHLTRSLRADVGVMISASHNPAHDNGIKLFGPDGYKLSDAAEAEIEALVRDGSKPAEPQDIGRARRIDDALGRYVEHVKNTFPTRRSLEGLRVVLDCANGAAYRAAPEVLRELGAEVIAIGVEPDGHNVNFECGSTHPEAAAAKVREARADVGVCLDGDADRVALIDECGRVADGDQLMALIATRWKREGRLAGDTLVATVMSNLGLERHLAENGITLRRTPVGDRYVVEEMRAGGYALGGEQSGHVVVGEHAATGDGLVSALQFLACLVESDQSASALLRVFEPVPQKLLSVKCAPDSAPLSDAAVKQAVAAAEERLAGRGRLVIRMSGTEPVIRIMAEAEDPGLLDEILAQVSAAVKAAG